MVDASHQTWLNNLWSFNLTYNFNNSQYYENTLKLLTMIVVSGNWWNPPITRTISFSGYQWSVKNSVSLVGPGPNIFSDSTANVWVDGQGELHLKITKRNGSWQCGEVSLIPSLGNGRYVFHVASMVGAINPNVVLGLFTWDDAPAQNHREIDIEFSRWADSTDTANAQFVVQPYFHAENLVRWKHPLSLDSSTNSFDWKATNITFLSVKGQQSFPPYDSVISSWTYSGTDIPNPGNEHVGINLWLFQGHAPTDNQEIEVVISKFEFNPLPPPPAPPSLVSPTDHATIPTPFTTLRWIQSSGSATYHVQVATDSTFASLILTDSTLTDTSRHMTSLVNGTSYYWRVRTKNIGGTSAWSSVRQFTYSNPDRWKLLSLPFKVTDPHKNTLFPTAVSNAFAYDPASGYITKDSIENRIGYWVKFGPDQTMNIAGDSILADTIDVFAGWNLIGSISRPVAVTLISSIPLGATTSAFFGYSGLGYAISDSIRPASGYWVKVNQSAQLIFSPSSVAPNARRITIIETSELPPPPPQESIVKDIRTALTFTLEQNYPNPFNPTTMIRFSLPSPGFTILRVFNMLGQEVSVLIHEQMSAGQHSVEWKADGFPNGIYFCRLEMSGGFLSPVRKLILLK